MWEGRPSSLAICVDLTMLLLLAGDREACNARLARAACVQAIEFLLLAVKLNE